MDPELTGDEQLKLRDALRCAYLSPSDFDALLLVFQTSLNDLSAEDTYPNRILAVIKQAQSQRWLTKLVDKASELNPRDVDLGQVKETLKTRAVAAPPTTNPFEVCLLSGGHILVNRSKLRNALQELHKGSKRILIVKDDPVLAQQIKALSLQMISRASEVAGGFNLVVVDLEEVNRAVASGKLVEPCDLAKHIMSKMGCQETASYLPPDGRWAWWTLHFCKDFQAAAKTAAKTWLVIDSCDLVSLPLETMDLIKELAMCIERQLPNLRMVVLGYPNSLDALGLSVTRESLGTALQELCRPNGQRTLAVSTASIRQRIKTGKSHSLQMISYLEQIVGGFEVVQVDLEDETRAVGSGGLIQPHDLAKRITAQMGCKHVLPAPPSDGQWARWTLDFCDNFHPVAKKAPKTWIVIDSFHAVLLPAETVDLLKALAQLINTTLSNLRMVLLGYSDSFPPKILPTVAEEPVKLISEDELMEFFARAYREKSVAFTADKVADKVVAVLEGLDPAQPDFVARIGLLAMAELDRP
jgi:hypothetical protein